MNSRIRIKFCGMTRQQDIQAAIQLGVDAVGIILYPDSKRNISISQAKEILTGIPPFFDVVAVVVNPDTEQVEKILDELPIQYLQFHGQESRTFCEQFSMPYIKSVAAESSEAIIQAADHYSTATAILLDTPVLNQHGGSGKTFDWNIIPKHLSLPYILAGGLNTDNLGEALSQTAPYALDVCTGVELTKGIKQMDKMKDFVNKVRENEL